MWVNLHTKDGNRLNIQVRELNIFEGRLELGFYQNDINNASFLQSDIIRLKAENDPILDPKLTAEGLKRKK